MRNSPWTHGVGVGWWRAPHSFATWGQELLFLPCQTHSSNCGGWPVVLFHSHWNATLLVRLLCKSSFALEQDKKPSSQTHLWWMWRCENGKMCSFPRRPDHALRPIVRLQGKNVSSAFKNLPYIELDCWCAASQLRGSEQRFVLRGIRTAIPEGVKKKSHARATTHKNCNLLSTPKIYRCVFCSLPSLAFPSRNS